MQSMHAMGFSSCCVPFFRIERQRGVGQPRGESVYEYITQARFAKMFFPPSLPSSLPSSLPPSRNWLVDPL
jgi:hypothetical protein